jgi:branched-chain amino acid transport system permease protein
MMDAAGNLLVQPSHIPVRRISHTLIPSAIVFALAAILPLVTNNYWVLIGTRAAIYWVLVSGLNLIVGFAGQLAIGYVAVLTLGAYTASVLVGGNIAPAFPVFAAFAAAAVVGAIAGVIVGLPALRLRTFYFAMTTLGFATIVDQVALAWQSVTGGGVGIAGPTMPAPFATAGHFFYLCLALAIVCTWLTTNIARSRFGRSLIALRDAEVAAEACGVKKIPLLVAVFIFAGALAGIAGGLFASLQSYITPDAFPLNLSILFFISVLIGGRGSIVGPLIGTIILTVLPEIAAPLAAWSNFLYAFLLLIIVIVIPGGIAGLTDFERRRPLESHREIIPAPACLEAFAPVDHSNASLELENIELAFGGLCALAGIHLSVRPGQVHGLIGPNGSGKTTTLNVISGYYRPRAGRLMLGGELIPAFAPAGRAALGLTRTFQAPRIVGDASVIQNVMMGATITGRASFAEALVALPRASADEARIRRMAHAALEVVGLERLADAHADRLKHSEQRFLEIARALVIRPRFLLLDEPAAGLSLAEIARLGELIKAIRRQGIGVLLVEHHTDLIFDVSDRITVLNLGKVLASGTPAEIRAHEEVVNVYLGG